MNKLILSIFIICSTHFVGAQKNGQIKKVTTMYFEEDFEGFGVVYEKGTTFYKTSEEERWFNINGQDSLLILKSKNDDFKPKKTTYLYYPSGVLELITHLNVRGNMASIEKFKYDSLNRLINKSISDMTDLSIVNTYYEYNLKGEIIETKTIVSDSDEALYNFRYKYKNGNMVKRTNVLDSTKMNFKYNKHGDCIYAKSNTKITLSEYEYDEFGNWIKWYDWTPKYGNKPNHPSGTRTIEYYN